MTTWKHRNWPIAKGTWMIASKVLTDAEIKALITSDPAKYGNLSDWAKQ